MVDSGLKDLSQVIAKEMAKISGNEYGPKQMPMVTSRLQRRILDLGFENPDQYYRHFIRNRKDELKALVSLLTTHHTFFFREFSQILTLDQHLKSLVAKAKADGRNHLRIWSAACSYGHEVYTLAMFLEKHLVKSQLNFDYKIFGTDIDPKAVQKAANGVFKKTDLDKVPLTYSSGHWDIGKSENLKNYVRVKGSLRKKCEFQVHNLLESSKKFGEFDLILVRNVLIYFNQERVKISSKNLSSALAPHGLILCGVSEQMETSSSQLRRVSASLYSPMVSETVVVDEPAKKTVAPEKLTRVVCVDDSKSVLSLLKKILTKEAGFEIVGTAMDGEEAAPLIRSLKPDVVTLDIHMPKVTGIEYLQKNMSDDHPPVLIVSSAERGDRESGLKALEYGASDYVQKPSLQNFAQCKEEIYYKLKTILQTERSSLKEGVELEKKTSKEFAKDVDPSNWLCVVGDPHDVTTLEKLERFDLEKQQVLFFNSPVIRSFFKEKKVIPSTTRHLLVEDGKRVTPSHYLVQSGSDLEDLSEAGFELTFLLLGDAGNFFNDVKLALTKTHNIILEDIDANLKWKMKADYTVPIASMMYHAHQLQVEGKKGAA